MSECRLADPAGGDAVAAIRLDHVVAGYYADQPVLQDLSLDCAPGRVTALLGPNGAGKSTALKVMAGLLRPSAGRVLLFGREVTQLTAHELAQAGVAFLPQGRSLFPELSVEDNLELGGWVLDRSHRRSAVQAMYERFPELRANRRAPAGRLSGGQQRLLEISCALVADPKVVVVDEPSVGLSPILAERSYEELRRLKQEGRTVVLVDQNVRPAVALADYICSLRSGQVERAGTPGDLATDLSALVREWLGVEQTGTAPPGPADHARPATPAEAPEGRSAR